VDGSSTTARPTRLQQWLRIKSEDKRGLYEQVHGTTELASLNYWLGIVFSAGIATFGLVLNSPAVIIGAMIISPMMGPIMAAGLGLASGDLYLTVKAIANLMLSIALAILLSAFFVWILPFHYATSEILSRTTPNLLDLGVALLSGLAGSVATCRAGKGSDAMMTLPGVAIAVALMPPLCAMGFGLGAGANLAIMRGAGLLFLTNLVAIVSSAFMVFLLIGMNAPSIRAHMEHAREGEAFTRRVKAGPLGRLLKNSGQLHWRIVVLVLLLAVISVPLRTALMQVAGEAVARDVVQQVVQGLLPSQAVVSQVVEVGRQNVAVRLVATRSLSPAQVQAAEQAIQRRSGRKAEISLESVASQSELARLMQKVNAPPQVIMMPPPAPQTIAQIDQKLMSQLSPVVQTVWPAAAPLQSFSLSFGMANAASSDSTPGSGAKESGAAPPGAAAVAAAAPTGAAASEPVAPNIDSGVAVLHATYAGDRPLSPIALSLLTQNLRDKLADPTLALDAHYVRPKRHGRR
jgi:uncharacterized hydrophobic protein (TIGR00271 family)